MERASISYRLSSSSKNASISSNCVKYGDSIVLHSSSLCARNGWPHQPRLFIRELELQGIGFTCKQCVDSAKALFPLQICTCCFTSLATMTSLWLTRFLLLFDLFWQQLIPGPDINAPENTRLWHLAKHFPVKHCHGLHFTWNEVLVDQIVLISPCLILPRGASTTTQLTNCTVPLLVWTHAHLSAHKSGLCAAKLGCILHFSPKPARF